MSESQKPKTCFVICPIKEPESKTRKRSDKVLEHIITPAVRECGYGNPVRSDRSSQPGMITPQIIEHLIDDDLVIADMTDNNGNVFYELAIRHVTQKPYIAIIQACQKIPFDVNQVRTIRYGLDTDSGKNCKKQIINQIKSIHEGTRRVDSPISQALAFRIVRSIYESVDIKMNIHARTDLDERQAEVGGTAVPALHITIWHEHTESVQIHKASIQPHDALHVHQRAAPARTSALPGKAYELKFGEESKCSDPSDESMLSTIEWGSATPYNNGKRRLVYVACQRLLKPGDRAYTFLPLCELVDPESIKKPDKYGTVGYGTVCLEYSLTPSEKLENTFPVE